MALLIPRYLVPADVQEYLLNKIDVGTNPSLQQITPTVLASWVRQGEVKVEKDLYIFYYTPFQTKEGDDWTELPTSTYDLLWNLLMTSAQIFVLEQQFGRITNTTGQDYIAYLRAEYKDYLNSFYMKAGNGSYILNQAQNLRINRIASNSNGLIPAAESVVNMRSMQMEYAMRQINNPAVTWYSRWASQARAMAIEEFLAGCSDGWWCASEETFICIP